MGGFNAKHFADPLGLTIGKGQGGGAKNFWDPAGLFTNNGNNAASAIDSAPVPVPAPPVTADSAEVLAAQKDLARQNLLKKSVKKTIFAGDTSTNMGGPGSPMLPPASYKKG